MCRTSPSSQRSRNETGRHRRSVCLHSLDPWRRLRGWATRSEQRARGLKASAVRPQSSGTSEASQTACEARSASAIGNCEKSSTGFGRIFFNRKGRDDSEPNSRQEPSSAAECGCTIAQQCAPSQPQSRGHFGNREPQYEECRRHRRAASATAAVMDFL
jgi:hypothetical protein